MVVLLETGTAGLLAGVAALDAGDGREVAVPEMEDGGGIGTFTGGT